MSLDALYRRSLQSLCLDLNMFTLQTPSRLTRRYNRRRPSSPTLDHFWRLLKRPLLVQQCFERLVQRQVITGFFLTSVARVYLKACGTVRLQWFSGSFKRSEGPCGDLGIESMEGLGVVGGGSDRLDFLFFLLCGDGLWG